MAEIVGIGGILSSGKTLLGVKLCLDSKNKGKRIISNIKLNFPYFYLSTSELVTFLKRNFEDTKVIEKKFKNSVLFIDEITNLVNARKASASLNELITTFFMMLGKLDCDLVYTYQLLTSQIDVRLREITTTFCDCQRVILKANQDRSLRIIDSPIRIKVIMFKKTGTLGFKMSKFQFNPEKYFNLYNTREIILLDRDRYLKSRIR
jgi:hypothetical protein